MNFVGLVEERRPISADKINVNLDRQEQQQPTCCCLLRGHMLISFGASPFLVVMDPIAPCSVCRGDVSNVSDAMNLVPWMSLDDVYLDLLGFHPPSSNGVSPPTHSGRRTRKCFNMFQYVSMFFFPFNILEVPTLMSTSPQSRTPLWQKSPGSVDPRWKLCSREGTTPMTFPGPHR